MPAFRVRSNNAAMLADDSDTINQVAAIIDFAAFYSRADTSDAQILRRRTIARDTAREILTLLELKGVISE